MCDDSKKLTPGTLHRELLKRLPKMRGRVRAKVPQRLSALISPDDILQEVWIAAYRSIPTFVPHGSHAIDSWLMTITNSKIVDAVRMARALKRGGVATTNTDTRHRFTSLVDLFARVGTPKPTPSGEINVIERGHAVSMALNRLPNTRRQVICMRHIEGRSTKEIAETLGKTEGAVNSLIHRSLCELRILLGDAAKYFSDVRSSDGSGSLGLPGS